MTTILTIDFEQDFATSTLFVVSYFVAIHITRIAEMSQFKSMRLREVHSRLANEHKQLRYYTQVRKRVPCSQ
ncbi:hypothetical protein RALBFv3_23525 (plasmid) [Ralstonia solanacearum]|nr:hypothetical protein RALBFv3_15920 [Ralstonia solanacearum]AMP77071.1 hypothetical protein RALBFv3_23525 [Ralstonia solanacearum]OAI68464.1 hypothetical protein RSP797_19345 [Ralstonia solanacearum]